MGRFLISFGCVWITCAVLVAESPWTVVGGDAANCPPASSRLLPCLQCKKNARHCLCGRHQFVSGEQPIHTPYDALNMYYYNRAYQYWQSETSSQEQSRNQAFRERMNQDYEQRKITNSPLIGAVDSLEFSDLPGGRNGAGLER